MQEYFPIRNSKIAIQKEWGGLTEFVEDQRVALEAILQAAGTLQSSISRFKEKFPIGRMPALGRVRPLERYFVEGMQLSWTEFTGEDAPASKSGPFVDLVLAAWSDLRFDSSDGVESALISYCGRGLRN